MAKKVKHSTFGSQTPWAEPTWYNTANATPYYGEPHKKFRAKLRQFVDQEVIPNVENWEKGNDTIPLQVYKKAGEIGLLPAIVSWPDNIPGVPKRPEGFDHFFSLMAQDEVCRSASGGVVWGLVGALGIGLPPIVHFGSDEMKQKVVVPCLAGTKRIALAVSESSAGSDVGNLKTTAEDKGDYYLVNGAKKWITGGLFADFFTVAARTGDENSGMGGVELILVEKSMPGVSVEAMECMGAKGSGTAFVMFEDAKVPKSNFIGGVAALMMNFVSERIGIAQQATRFSRMCLQLSIERTERRKAFGKALISMPVVKHKLADMAREISASQAYIDSIVYRVVQAEKAGMSIFEGVQRIGPEAMLLKVHASKVFEKCAHDAAMLHGGDSYVKGNRIESLYRHVLSLAIPGGSADVMIDAAARLTLKRPKSRL
mmetsp:Transcript_5867/g.11189  ORF Transcript_5867/g.11189 Transcript_5867/m.11189 type:complete len:428 (+) Transcript_5867:41-1324(+)|eukprot:CAMPEP_0175139582 /NCGR_PEP_ID=MMETSP0087-20121206/10986_1 /TAXON_ID=136419 /ORGANISM="Unknown Unknown, Strain D1" /LENGTH=427 /DNA_ID=CAMNT_0016422615 /DNA_START=38 /DNA_END=1321 /DNA_ORIENTATION=-